MGAKDMKRINRANKTLLGGLGVEKAMTARAKRKKTKMHPSRLLSIIMTMSLVLGMVALIPSAVFALDTNPDTNGYIEKPEDVGNNSDTTGQGATGQGTANTGSDNEYDDQSEGTNGTANSDDLTDKDGAKPGDDDEAKLGDDDEEGLLSYLLGLITDIGEQMGILASDEEIDEEEEEEEIEEIEEATAEIDICISSWATLRDAIANASSDEEYVVEITASFNHTGAITIPSGKNIKLVPCSDAQVSLTIQGSYRHFIVAGTLTLSDGVTLTNHNPGAYAMGGGVDVAGGGVFNMSGGTISGNRAPTGYGGGVYIYNNGIFNMRGGTINNNLAVNQNGNAGDGGGVFVNDGGSFYMSGGVIRNNTGSLRAGGVWVQGRANNTGSFVMNGGEIRDNTASSNGGTAGGGGVFLYSYNTAANAVFTMNDGTISGNKGRDGGGIFVHGGTFNMRGGTITGNTVTGPGGGSGHGGGVFLHGTSAANISLFNMSGGTISNNTAPLGAGAGFLVHQHASAIMTAGTVTRNTSGSVGGGVYLYSPTGLNNTKFELRGGTITGNTSQITTLGGGGIYANTGTAVTISGGTVNTNTAYYGGGVYIASGASLSMSGGTVTGNNVSRDGGGVYNAGTFTMSGTAVVSSNTASGTATNNGGGGVFTASAFTMNGGTINANTATQSGGGVHVSASGIFNFNDGTIGTNNRGNARAGGVYVTGGTMTMRGGTVSSNNSVTTGGIHVTNNGIFNMHGGRVIGNTTSSSSGGGVTVADGALGTMYDGEISGNRTTGTQSAGGGVYVLTNSTAARNTIFTMKGGNIINNSSSISGGAMYVYRPQANTGARTSIFNMEGGNISGNTAVTNCGGVFVNWGCQFNMSGGKITNNRSNASGGGVQLGNNSIMTMSGNAEISNNTATNNGGGVLVATGSTLTMEGGSINGNRTTANSSGNGNGGGIHAATGTTINLNGGEISGNASTQKDFPGGGGGVYSDGIFNMRGGKLNNNTAARNGGGVFTTNTINLTGGEINGNTTVLFGGGILVGARARLTMADATISGNSSENGGGGISVDSTAGTSAILNSGTIIGNTARINGGGINSNYDNLTVRAPVIFSENKAGSYTHYRNPVNNAIYTSRIFATNWTSPFTQGFNNYDINHSYAVTVTFTSGSNGTLDLHTVIPGDDLTIGSNMPPDPVREGFIFKGWSTVMDGTEADFTSSTIITGAMSVYAVWEHAVYTITLKNEVSDDVIVMVEHGITLGESGFDLSNPDERDGYTFKGWNTERDGSGLRLHPDIPIVGDMTFYAIWVQNSGAWIDGIVKDEDGDKLPDILVKIMFHGSDDAGTDVAETRTGKESDYGEFGWFMFDGLPFGNYSLVYIDEVRGIQVTKNIIIDRDGRHDGSVEMPTGSKNTVLHVEGKHTPNVSVANLAEMFDSEDNAIAATGNLVTMTLHVEQIHVGQINQERNPGDVDLIAEHVRSEGEITNVLYLDMWLVRSVNGFESQIIQPRGNLTITIDVPHEFRDQTRILHVHNGVVYEIEGRSRTVGNTTMLTFEADRFSTFALVITDDTDLNVETRTDTDDDDTNTNPGTGAGTGSGSGGQPGPVTPIIEPPPVVEPPDNDTGADIDDIMQMPIPPGYPGSGSTPPYQPPFPGDVSEQGESVEQSESGDPSEPSDPGDQDGEEDLIIQPTNNTPQIPAPIAPQTTTSQLDSTVSGTDVDGDGGNADSDESAGINGLGGIISQPEGAIQPSGTGASTDPATPPIDDTNNVNNEGMEININPFNETPLFIADTSWALFNLLLTILTGLITAALLATWLAHKKRRESGDIDTDDSSITAHDGINSIDDTDGIDINSANDTGKTSSINGIETKQSRKIIPLLILSIFTTLAAIVLFILTQNMNSPMIMTDIWTIWMAAIAAIQVAIAFVVSESRRRKQKILV
jgi:uncharacterized repeat protein (TIGR02543 family)